MQGELMGTRMHPLRRMQGLTIIQTMVILLIAGFAGLFLVNYLIDKRCEENPATDMCASRQK